ncbi:MAG: hypothetical protein U9N09_09385, partial [Euryarchaeota archaeon]|nr:hypothetical protein [Euryarchaeota archaeon]
MILATQYNGRARLPSMFLEEAVKLKVGSREHLDAVFSDLAGEDEWRGVDIERVKPLMNVFWKRNRDRIRSNLMVEQ